MVGKMEEGRKEEGKDDLRMMAPLAERLVYFGTDGHTVAGVCEMLYPSAQLLQVGVMPVVWTVDGIGLHLAAAKDVVQHFQQAAGPTRGRQRASESRSQGAMVSGA